MMAAQQAVVRFDLASIPESSQMELIATVHDAVTAYFQQPGVAEKYEAWLQQKKSRKQVKK